MSQVVTITTEQKQQDEEDILLQFPCANLLAATIDDYTEKKKTEELDAHGDEVQGSIDNAEDLREMIESFRPIVEGDAQAERALRTALDNIDFILEGLNSLIKANAVADFVVDYAWIFLALEALLPTAHMIQDPESDTYLNQCLQLFLAIGTVAFIMKCVLRFHVAVKLDREVKNVDESICRWEETYISKLEEDRLACEAAIEELKQFFHHQIYDSDKLGISAAEERLRALRHKEMIHAVSARLAEYEADLKKGREELSALQDTVQKLMRRSYAGQLGGLALAAGGAVAGAIGVYNGNSQLIAAGGVSAFLGLGILTLSAAARARLENQLQRLDDCARILDKHSRSFHTLVEYLNLLLSDVQQDQETKRLRAQAVAMTARMAEMEAELRRRKISDEDAC